MKDEKLKRLEELKLEVLSRPATPMPSNYEFNRRGWRFLPLSDDNYDYCVCDTCGARGYLYATHLQVEHHKPDCQWSNNEKANQKIDSSDQDTDSGDPI